MHVVPAGMHHRDVAAVPVDSHGGARIVQPGLLPYGQRIHVGAEQRGRPRAVTQHAHDPGSADPGRRLIAKGTEPPGHDRGRPHLAEGELRVGVQVSVDRGQVHLRRAGRSHPSPPCGSTIAAGPAAASEARTSGAGNG